MTIEEAAAPQDRDNDHGLSSHLEIEELVRLLDEKSKAADERAKAADDRSTALAERTGCPVRTAAPKPFSLYNNYEPEPFDPERRSIRFLELGTASIRNFAKEGNDDELQTVVGVEEKESSNNASDLAERISLIEMRLDEFEETKEPV
jgi:hypothetical protein